MVVWPGWPDKVGRRMGKPEGAICVGLRVWELDVEKPEQVGKEERKEERRKKWPMFLLWNM